MLKTYYVAVMPNVSAEDILSLGSDLLNFYEERHEAEAEKYQSKNDKLEIVEITVLSLKDRPTNKDIH